MNQIEQLLEYCIQVNADLKDKEKQTGDNINLFETLNVEYNEVRICRVLHELLNPKGSHNKGDAFLRLFMDEIEYSQKVNSTFDFNNATVYREYLIKNKKRIDLFITDGKSNIPIEVKIYAEDQKDQLNDYLKETNDCVYYLTLDGKEPSDYSVSKENSESVERISFSHHILNWLEKCEEIIVEEANTPLKELFRQFKQTIRKITHKRERVFMEQLEAYLMSEDITSRLQAAIDVRSNLDIILNKKIVEVFALIEKELEQVGYTKLDNIYDYAKDGKANNFYTSKKNTCPGLSYLVQGSKEVLEDRELWLRLEIKGYKMFIGYCVAKDNETTSLRPEDKALIKQLVKELRVDYWWGWWSYINESPNFNNRSEIVSLYNKNDLDSFIKRCVETVTSKTIDLNNIKS